MTFQETSIADAWVIELELLEDRRGFFARTFDADTFERRGLTAKVAQCSTSFNPRRGTLRGLHYQEHPHEEAKLIRCISGAVFDVAVDLRTGSPTYLNWFGIELNASNRRLLYVPEGCAHGYLTLRDDTELAYQISVSHDADSGRGVRWNDPVFAIEWPAGVCVISERDRTYPDFVPLPQPVESPT